MPPANSFEVSEIPRSPGSFYNYMEAHPGFCSEVARDAYTAKLVKHRTVLAAAIGVTTTELHYVSNPAVTTEQNKEV